VVVVDAAHGGQETGATLASRTYEKDVTLALARRVRASLQKRDVPALLLREEDRSLSTEERAESTNRIGRAIYVGLHASASGSGVSVVTARMNSRTGKDSGLLAWDAAQAAYLQGSERMASRMAEEFAKKKLSVHRRRAEVPPLRHLAAPAVLLEITPGDGPSQALNSAAFQELISEAVAGAVADFTRSYRAQAMQDSGRP
jgi:N-acetylmuramoyl-L-alanine amidase